MDHKSGGVLGLGTEPEFLLGGEQTRDDCLEVRERISVADDVRDGAERFAEPVEQLTREFSLQDRLADVVEGRGDVLQAAHVLVDRQIAPHHVAELRV